MDLKKILITAIICGAMILGFSGTIQSEEISLDNQIEIQQLSHWTQFRNGFYKNVLSINRDKDSDRNSHYHDRHHSNHHYSHKNHHYK